MGSTNRLRDIAAKLRDAVTLELAAEEIEDLRHTAHYNKAAEGEALERARNAEAERDALAARVVDMRSLFERFEAYRAKYPQWMWDSMMQREAQGISNRPFTVDDRPVTHVPATLFCEVQATLALPLTAAEQRVREWREKAELLDWLIRSRECAELTAWNTNDAVMFVLKVMELYGPWSYEQGEWDDEQILNALRAAKEAGYGSA